MSTTPTTTAAITAEWLTGALRSSGVIGAPASVTKVEFEPGSAGVGFMGEVGKLSVTYEGADDAPSSIIAKFPTQNPEISAMMRPTRVFEREHRFYADLAAETPVRTPVAYHVVCETNPDPDVAEAYLLLMEDLSGLTEGDQVAGVSVEQASAALTGLAQHHARFWNGAGLESADFIPPVDGPLNQAGQSIYEASLPGFKQVFGDLLTPEMDALADAYTAANPSLLAAFGQMPTTLVHFDFRADNLFFDTDGSVVVIDWQAISRGGGAADVGILPEPEPERRGSSCARRPALARLSRHARRERCHRIRLRHLLRRLPARDHVRLDHSGIRRWQPRCLERASNEAVADRD